MEVNEPSAEYLRTSGYTQTELGVLPADWRIAEIGQIAETSSGTTPPRSQHDRYFKGGVHAWVKTLDLNNAEIRQTDESVTDEAVAETNLRLFPEGSVLVAMYGGLRQIGRTGLLRLPASVNQAITVIRPDPTRLCSEFLLFNLNHRVGHWQSVASSSRKDPNITGADVRAFKIPMPGIGEQRRVAAALTDTDALIDSLEQLLTKKRQIKQGAMQELLTGKRRLPGFNGNWRNKRLGDLLSIRHGRSQKQVESDNGEYPILATGGQIGWANAYLCEKPSVLIGRKGTINQPRYMDMPFWSVDTLFFSEVHRPNVAKFLYYRFCLIDWMGYNEASGVPSLNAKVIESIEIVCPDADEQQDIADTLSDIDTEITALESRLTKARDLKQAMAQALLTGRIRLVEEGAAA